MIFSNGKELCNFLYAGDVKLTLKKFTIILILLFPFVCNGQKKGMRIFMRNDTNEYAVCPFIPAFIPEIKPENRFDIHRDPGGFDAIIYLTQYAGKKGYFEGSSYALTDVIMDEFVYLNAFIPDRKKVDNGKLTINSNTTWHDSEAHYVEGYFHDLIGTFPKKSLKSDTINLKWEGKSLGELNTNVFLPQQLEIELPFSKCEKNETHRTCNFKYKEPIIVKWKQDGSKQSILIIEVNFGTLHFMDQCIGGNCEPLKMEIPDNGLFYLPAYLIPEKEIYQGSIKLYRVNSKVVKSKMGKTYLIQARTTDSVDLTAE